MGVEKTVASIICLLGCFVGALMNIIHFINTCSLKPDNRYNNLHSIHSKASFAVRQRLQRASRRIIQLSHLSMVLMLFVIIHMTLSYFYPISTGICTLYWVISCSLYTIALYFLKWLYLIRAYTIGQTLDENHIICKFIKGLFYVEVVFCCCVIFAMTRTLSIDSDQDNTEYCHLKFDLIAAYIPIGLMLLDTTLLTLFTCTLFRIGNSVSRDEYANEEEESEQTEKIFKMKIGICYHYGLTMLCITICWIDYAVSTYYVGTTIVIDMVIIDCLSVIFCNFLITHDKFEQFAIKYCSRIRTGFC